MTVSTTGNKAIFTGNGTATNFAFSFKALNETDIKVYLYDPAAETLQLIAQEL